MTAQYEHEKAVLLRKQMKGGQLRYVSFSYFFRAPRFMDIVIGALQSRLTMRSLWVKSLGPLCSSSKSMARSAGKSVEAISQSSFRARSVVQRPLRQRRTSARRSSSCCSLDNKISKTSQVLQQNTYRHSISIIRYSRPTSSVIPPWRMKVSTQSTVSFLSRRRSLCSLPISTSCGLCIFRR